MLSIPKYPEQYAQLLPAIFYLLCCAFQHHVPPLGGVRPEKKYPTPMCKKVSQPQFFSRRTPLVAFSYCVSVAYMML